MTMWELYVKIRDMQYAIIRGEEVDEEEFEELVNRYNEMHKKGQKNI